MAKKLGLVYIIGTYPGLTTTFIDREIRTLRHWGVDLQIVAIRRPPLGTPLSEDQQELQQGVIYLLPVVCSSLVLSQLYFALLYPRRFFKVLAYLLTRPHPDPQARLMTLLHFGQGVYTAYLLRKRRFQELHAHFVDRAATVALVAGRLLGKPYSLSVHAGPDIFVDPILLREKIVEARHVAACTLYNKVYLETIVGQDINDKVSHVHHGLDLTKYIPSPPTPNGRPLILSVGQLTERKGFVRLIEACRDLRVRGYDLTCHIVGHGPQRQDLEDLITQLSLQDTVILCGALPHEEVIEKYRQATIFVLPCVKSRDGNMDGIPNVLAEAMAMRLPVVSTDVSAIPELVAHRVNGLLIPSRDDTALVTAIACLLNDDLLREQLGRNGRRTVVESFDAERNIRQFAGALWPEWFD